MRTAPLQQPVFIVGLPRTGSKLLMNIINNNATANYHIANEVQFFGHSFLGRLLQGRRGIMPLVNRERNENGKINWERVVHRLYSGQAKGVHWNGLAAGWLSIPKSRLLDSLSATDGTARAVYSAILKTQEQEYVGYGDKSGPNLYFVDTLLKWFPDCKILHIIRDPRAILASQHKRLMLVLEHDGSFPGVVTSMKKLCYSPIIVTYILTYWGRAIRIDSRLTKSHPQHYMRVQFEKLVAEPEKITRQICNFLSIPWHPQMVEPPKRDSSYIDPSDLQQKVDRGRGMDRDAAERWRKHLRPWMAATLRVYGSLFYGDALTRFGYVDDGESEHSRLINSLDT